MTHTPDLRYEQSQMEIQMTQMACWDQMRFIDEPVYAGIAARQYARSQAAAIGWASR